jgi:hypothetical protein
MDSVKIYRFYRPTCGACSSSQSEWDNFKSAVLFRRVTPIDINTESGMISKNADLSVNFGIKGVPSIWKVYADGRRFEYKGDRSTADLISFSLNDTQV